MKEFNKCHFIGIGGIGMSALAQFLLGVNKQVSGSDAAASAMTEKLCKMGAKIFIGHAGRHVETGTTVVYSTDIKPDNPELQTARTLNCPILHRSELLNLLMSDKKALAVAGTHGKTTTSSLLSWVFAQGNLDPSCIVGGILVDFKSNCRIGKGDYFIAEADESDGTFLAYSPWGSIVTNIGLDHLSFYQSEAHLINAFKTFMQKNIACPERLFWCGDDPRLKQLNMPGIPYGTGSDSVLRASRIVQDGWKMLFDIHFEKQVFPQVELPLIGRHNVLNALAVFGMALKAGLDEVAIRRAFQTFNGVLRRCEKKGEGNGVLVIDDYGHHPTEIQTTLEAIRMAVRGRRLIAVFQPHRYTRTRDCLGTYSSTFEVADVLVLTDIYAGGEDPIPGAAWQDLMKELSFHYPNALQYFARDDLEEQLLRFVRPEDVVVAFGAGDLNKASAGLARQLESVSVSFYDRKK